jgi:two-component system NtrC family response regulator/two-component system response regulator AtoC
VADAKAPTTSVLLVDDDETFRRVMSTELRRRGYEITTAATGREALELSARGGHEVILLDLRLPDLTGIEVLEQLGKRELAAGVVVLTGHGTIDTAIQAIRLGAYDYLQKPCPIEKLELTVLKTRDHMRLLARQRVLQDGFSPPDVSQRMIGASPAIEKLRLTIGRIASTQATTLIQGETGVGKEMVATLLHTQSPRKDAPFVVVDCASLHEEILQSELFGHEKGAFTGAMRHKHGLFEVADGGTLFLDEIGEASPEIQAQLLRVLETGRFRHLGGTQEVEVDVRVISATNRDLREAVTCKRFREDLFFRLTTLTVRVPPLRERLEDIPLLVHHFCGELNRRLSRSIRFGSEAVAALQGHAWPGNVRELIHVLEQSMILCDGDVVGPRDLPASIRAGGRPAQADVSDGELLALEEVERAHLMTVLSRVGGNRSRAAEVLGISERNLYRLIGKYRSRSQSSATERSGETDAGA